MKRVLLVMACLCLLIVPTALNCISRAESPDVPALLQEAEAGNPDSMELLAECYENGTGTEQNIDYAAVWYMYAAEAGSTRAMVKLGQFYEEGTLFLQNLEKARTWYDNAAVRGNADAMVALGRCWAAGIGGYKSRETALEWFEKARAAGAENVDEVIGEVLAEKVIGAVDPEIVMEAYTPMILQAASYDYLDKYSEPTGEYEYALVKLQHNIHVPALLLRQLTGTGTGPVRVFQYDPESGTVLDTKVVIYNNAPCYFMFTDDETLCIRTYAFQDSYFYGTVTYDEDYGFGFGEGIYGSLEEGNTPDNRELADLEWHSISEINGVTEAETPETASAPETGGQVEPSAVADEPYMSFYRARIHEADRYDYQDYGEGAAGYQYALVYMAQNETIPALLLAERSWDGVRYVKVFQYDPAISGVTESLDPLNEYRAMLFCRAGEKGLLLWYSDGAYESGIMEVRLNDYTLQYDNLWYGENGTWPDEIPKEDINWTDIP